MRRSIMTPLLIGAIFLFGWQTKAWGQADITRYTRETFLEWLNKYKDAKPEFKPGDVLTHADLEKARPFVLPGYLEQLQKWEDIKMEVVPTHHVTPHKYYRECTEKYQAQVRLAEDGSLENYVCGQPFPIEDLKPEDPLSGLKWAWNYDKRWYWRGLFIINALATWVRFGGSHTPPEVPLPPEALLGEEVKFKPEDWKAVTADLDKVYGGGSSFGRCLGLFYHKAYYSHLAMFPGNNYMLPGSPEAGEVFWKEFSGFFSPYDVRGTAFIIKRYEEPRRTDDAWAYIPAIRRVRRVSAEVKSDSLLGTEQTLEDFYGFNGRVLEWEWKFHGWKDMLAVHAKSKWPDNAVHYGGPEGWLNDDVWNMRKVAIVERFPTDPRHPYSSSIMAVDSETWEAIIVVAFDRKGNLWKVTQWGWMWSDDTKQFTDWNQDRSTPLWSNAEAVDVQNARANLWRGYGRGLPDFSVGFINRYFDLNRLTEYHR